MKRFLLILPFYLLLVCSALSQTATEQTGPGHLDSSNPPQNGAKNPPPVNVQAILPAFSFNEHPVNHNMHITCDGVNYYTINGGNAGTGQINKFDLNGNLMQTYPIQIDGRGLSFNPADSFLYASLFMGDVVKITNLAGGGFTTVFPGAMHDGQASFAISHDGTKFYDFASGTLYVHDFITGAITDTITGLTFGAGNFGGNAAVAVDSNFIYTWDASVKTVYIYDLLGSFLQTMTLDSGDNGHSIAIANNLLFVSKDGNYGIGTWYGYGSVAPPPPGPSALFTCSDSTLCEKQFIDFFDLSTNNPTSWQWYFPNAIPDTSTSQNPTGIFYNAYGSYDVALVSCNAGGCDSLFFPGYVTVFQSPPQPTITQSQDTLFCSPAFSYSWFESSNPALVLSTDSFYVVTQNGNYFVIVTDSNGCGASSNILLINTGIDGFSLGNDSGVLFYPNPTDDLITFSFLDPFVHADVLVCNSLGRIVCQSSINNQKSTLKLPDLAQGFYILKIKSEKNQFIHKLIIQR